MTDYRAIVRSPQALGRALARARTKRGLTQQQLADALGISRQYVTGLESGSPNLYATRLFEILRELGGYLELHASVPDDEGRP